jgi:hypothetical protein
MKVLTKHGFQREHGDEINRSHTRPGFGIGLPEWGGLATALGVTTGGAVRRPTPTPVIPGMGGSRDAVVLEDIQGPLEIADGLSFSQGFFWALGLLALVGFLAWLWWRRRTPVGVEGKPADEVALERLRAAWPMMEHPKLFVGVVSDALRHYVENRFGLQAPERTTEEFLVELQNSRVLEESHKASLAEFLSHADLIKFAPHAPTQNELENLYNMATAWVMETMPLTDEVDEPYEDIRESDRGARS